LDWVKRAKYTWPSKRASSKTKRNLINLNMKGHPPTISAQVLGRMGRRKFAEARFGGHRVIGGAARCARSCKLAVITEVLTKSLGTSNPPTTWVKAPSRR